MFRLAYTRSSGAGVFMMRCCGRSASCARSTSDYGAMAGQFGVEFTITAEAGGVAPAQGMHLCFRARDREAVRAFHAAALATGGRDEGEPGPRTQYHRDYYAAFVLDPDGNRIEAVCHAPKAPEVTP
jgi:catechol 2,3-dioxygenase-like lactoylglutathione lyase family enzyme